MFSYVILYCHRVAPTILQLMSQRFNPIFSFASFHVHYIVEAWQKWRTESFCKNNFRQIALRPATVGVEWPLVDIVDIFIRTVGQ